MSSVRILMVDDFEPFMRHISLMLEAQPELQVIGEASDGLEAVEKAVELQPDLILLDFGLPKLNGIEAARRISRLAPQSKILFLSQETDADLAGEALKLGARGYVVKSDAGGELLPAVEAVLRGEQFVSSSLKIDDFAPAADNSARNRLLRREALALLAPQKIENSRRHEVQFYSDDACFLDGCTRFIGAALKDGKAVIVVATEPHRNSLLQRLQAHGLDVCAAVEQGSYIPLDVHETLATFMVNGWPDPARFLKVASGLVLSAAKAVKGEHPRVAGCGECAPLLCAEGKVDAAIRLEQLWDGIAKTYGVDILCGYSLKSFRRKEGSHIFQRICAEHSAVYSTGQ